MLAGSIGAGAWAGRGPSGGWKNCPGIWWHRAGLADLGSTREVSDVADVYWTKKVSEESVRRLVSSFLPIEGLEDTDLVAVKIHPGEEGNRYYVAPDLVQAVVEGLGLPGKGVFLTDTTVLYRGRRMVAPDYVRLAAEHGFGPPRTAPFIVADGLRGTDEVFVDLPEGFSTKRARMARLLSQVDRMVVVSHFKGHLLAGFGGAIKNLGMGCASRGGKLYQHSTVTPQVDGERCIACGVCAEHCPEDAIEIDEVAVIDQDRCVGCGECLQRCPTGAMRVSWNQRTDEFVRRVAEYAWAAIQLAPVALYVNFVTNVSPDCDCMSDAEAPLFEDVGLLASRDPVALDQACLDLVGEAGVLDPARLAQGGRDGTGRRADSAGRDEELDPFTRLRPRTHGPEQLAWAERLGFGTRDYRLHVIE